MNRALLARQLLLERRKLPAREAIERIGALQAQWPSSPYVALWSRLRDFDQGQLVRALERREVVKATLMRATLHIVSSADYLGFGGLMHDAHKAALRARLASVGISASHVEETAQIVGAAAAQRPQSRPELLRLVGEGPLRSDDARPWTIWHALQATAGLVHAPASAHWRATPGRTSFVAARAWFGQQPARDEGAARRLVCRYLTAFGPASQADLTSWSGLPVALLRPALEGLQPELRMFHDETGRRLFDLARRPLPPADTPSPVRFLPQWDSALLAYAPPERARILPEHLRKTVIRPNGDVLPSFLVDGFVAGLWRVEQTSSKAAIVLEPFEPLSSDTRRELEDEGARLVRFVAPEATAHAVRAGSAT
ncbi:MAG: winged helix DNA-binding domain-containing protein [Actinobacteria bacterium]|nr:winged helix DNA-binding domain-containing protein [Actinomycetota bacterium]